MGVITMGVLNILARLNFDKNDSKKLSVALLVLYWALSPTTVFATCPDYVVPGYGPVCEPVVNATPWTYQVMQGFYNYPGYLSGDEDTIFSSEDAAISDAISWGLANDGSCGFASDGGTADANNTQSVGGIVVIQEKVHSYYVTRWPNPTPPEQACDHAELQAFAIWEQRWPTCKEGFSFMLGSGTGNSTEATCATDPNQTSSLKNLGLCTNKPDNCPSLAGNPINVAAYSADVGHRFRRKAASDSGTWEPGESGRRHCDVIVSDCQL
jgi:hypothetical protein